jgi:uncharacterized protein with HEPN domain
MWRDAAWLHDMVEAGQQVLTYIRGVDQRPFLENEMLQDAVARQIMIIGEAAKNVSEEFRATHPEVPWQGMARFRDVLVHRYFNVNLDRVWEILQDNVPEMIALVTPLIPSEGE